MMITGVLLSESYNINVTVLYPLYPKKKIDDYFQTTLFIIVTSLKKRYLKKNKLAPM